MSEPRGLVWPTAAAAALCSGALVALAVGIGPALTPDAGSPRAAPPPPLEPMPQHIDAPVIEWPVLRPSVPIRPSPGWQDHRSGNGRHEPRTARSSRPARTASPARAPG